ncbi:MAG: nucleotidyltransferase family protein [Bacteroidales bacterium]|nr:nucleotidyltransferase family protein [Bacteroidales bacterium]
MNLWVVCALVVASLLLLAVLLAGFIRLRPGQGWGGSLRDFLDGFDVDLLDIAFCKSKTQADLDALLQDFDVEKAGLNRVLHLGHVLDRRTDLQVPDSYQPRLQGGAVVAKFREEKLLGHLRKVSAAFGEAGIKPVLLKGGAMLFYRPDFPRWIADIDMMIPEGRFDDALRIATGLGYGAPMLCGHSVDLHIPGVGEGVVDLHRHLELGTGRESAFNAGLFERAGEIAVGSDAVCLLPCREDLVFIEMVNMCKNLTKDQARQSTLSGFFDVEYLITTGGSFDWDIVREDASKTGTGAQLRIVASLVSSFLPDLFPRDWSASLPVTPKEMEGQLLELNFHHKVLASARDSFRATKLGASVQGEPGPLVTLWLKFVSLVRHFSGKPFVKRLVLRLGKLFSRNG